MKKLKNINIFLVFSPFLNQRFDKPLNKRLLENRPRSPGINLYKTILYSQYVIPGINLYKTILYSQYMIPGI